MRYLSTISSLTGLLSLCGSAASALDSLPPGLINAPPEPFYAEDYKWGLPAENCREDNYMWKWGDGSTTRGSAFCASKFKEGILIKSLDFKHTADRGVDGLTVEFTDGSIERFGNLGDERKGPDATYQKVEFDDSLENPITKLQIWPTGWDSKENRAVGKLVIDTAKGGNINLEHEWWDWSDPNTFEEIKEVGVLLGVEGRADTELNRLVFIFAAKPVRSMTIRDLTLDPSIDEINARQANDERGFVVEYLDELYHINTLDTPTEVWMAGDRKVTQSTTVTESTTHTFHMGLGWEFTAGLDIPLLGEGSVTTKIDMFWEGSTTDSTAETEGTEVTKSWRQIATAEPNTAIRCYAWAFKGTAVDVRWEGASRITFEDGTWLQYPNAGRYNTAKYTRVNTQCDKVDSKDVEELEKDRKSFNTAHGLDSNSRLYLNGEQVSSNSLLDVPGIGEEESDPAEIDETGSSQSRHKRSYGTWFL